MTKIEWTDETWNFLGGCSPVGEGCKHCAAARQAAGRLKNHPLYKGLTKDGRWTGEIRLCTDIGRSDILEKPLHWKNPRMIFPCFMGDLFHEKVPQDYRWKCFDTMWRADWHIYQILTKRPEIAKESWESYLKYSWRARILKKQLEPPKHIWFGTSISTQEDADKNIPILLQIPAAVRFVSIEPLLEKIDLTAWLNTGIVGLKKEQSNERKRDNVFKSSGVGSIQDRPQGQDLETEILGGRQSFHTKPIEISKNAKESRKSNIERTPKSDVHSESETLCGLCSSGRMDSSSSTTNSRRVGNKSQRRNTQQQQYSKSGGCYSSREHSTRRESLESIGQERTRGRKEFNRQANRPKSVRDTSNLESENNDSDTNCSTLRGTPSNHQQYLPQSHLDTSSLIHQVIVGGESGSGARPMHPDWPRSIRDQCVAAGVPFFFKQWGRFKPSQKGTIAVKDDGSYQRDSTGKFEWKRGYAFEKMLPLGKKKAGRLLDGKEWNEYPKVRGEV